MSYSIIYFFTGPSTPPHPLRRGRAQELMMPDGLLDCLQGQSHLAGTLCDMNSSDVKKLRPPHMEHLMRHPHCQATTSNNKPSRNVRSHQNK